MSASAAQLNYVPRPDAAWADPSLAVVCRGVTKTYGNDPANQVVALRGIDLEVRTGELLMLVGPSGCGKTTLISVIAGILDQNAGDCRVFGHDFKHMAGGAKTRYRGQTIGFVFQAFNLLPSLTAAENAAVPLLINGVKRKEAVDRAAAMLDRVGLGNRTKSLPSQLSGGQQQRVAIARALVHGPRLIVCDEPTGALDSTSGAEILGLLRQLVHGGQTVVMVTHDPVAAAAADRVLTLTDGAIVGDRPC